MAAADIHGYAGCVSSDLKPSGVPNETVVFAIHNNEGAQQRKVSTMRSQNYLKNLSRSINF